MTKSTLFRRASIAEYAERAYRCPCPAKIVKGNEDHDGDAIVADHSKIPHLWSILEQLMNHSFSSKFCQLFFFTSICIPFQALADTPSIANDYVECRIVVKDGLLVSDRLAAQPQWEKFLRHHIAPVETDADFSLEIMWTDWQSPLAANNAENPLILTKKHFTVVRQRTLEDSNGSRELLLVLRGKDVPLAVSIIYQLSPTSKFVRKRITIADSANMGHFLQHAAPIDGFLSSAASIIKRGGFGQPIAISTRESGAFFGMEYPAADNRITAAEKGFHVFCGSEIGEKISSAGIMTADVVIGLTPDSRVKQWFMEYVSGIRVVPVRPYILYNSWYDLRSAEYPHVPPENVMNEKNVTRIADLMRTNMTVKHGIPLDAFVLDDGWDVYESDWALRRTQFPNGLTPIADMLKKNNTTLGLWFGPTGGYSFRMKRINWMKQQGYEIVGNTPNTAMMCLAGTRYDSLFSKRVLDFTAQDGVGYFKWDGVQFSCSELNHGHSPGIFSRHAVMKSVANQCRAVRAKNPSAYLNITSGTWLSPWWVMHANQIWMQGEDYGYADVPSISPRDAAITYRDLSLYEDFRKNDFWFPMQNLMTHGIIKGTLQKLGGESEPLDKFANEVMLYLARGVSMWELYISPDILTEDEWMVMASAMCWARDRFSIFSATEMIGGDPKKRESYGYVHFKGNHGIIAARNPFITDTSLSVRLNPEYGLDAHASGLVLERVYPDRWISPLLYKSGDRISLPLSGYETAVYELYPLAESNEPLLAGATFRELASDGKQKDLQVMTVEKNARLLNPETAENADLSLLAQISGQTSEAVEKKSLLFTAAKTRPEMSIAYHTAESTVAVSIAVLVMSASKKVPVIIAQTGGIVDTLCAGPAAGTSRWFTTSLPPGRQRTIVRIAAPEERWKAEASVWLLCRQKKGGVRISLRSRMAFLQRPMPPSALPAGETEMGILLGEWRTTEE
ncbi:MAG: alpha-galactosidase [Ignavibacteriales bacterium]|nr:alpha-galactosidase [Ignavibacteriales bacterium]